jgi:hypothetical protein
MKGIGNKIKKMDLENKIWQTVRFILENGNRIKERELGNTFGLIKIVLKANLNKGVWMAKVHTSLRMETYLLGSGN